MNQAYMIILPIDIGLQESPPPTGALLLQRVHSFFLRYPPVPLSLRKGRIDSRGAPRPSVGELFWWFVLNPH